MNKRKERVKTFAIIGLAIALCVSVLINCTSGQKYEIPMREAFIAGHESAIIEEGLIFGIISEEEYLESKKLQEAFMKNPLEKIDELSAFQQEVVKNIESKYLEMMESE